MSSKAALYRPQLTRRRLLGAAVAGVTLTAANRAAAGAGSQIRRRRNLFPGKPRARPHAAWDGTSGRGFNAAGNRPTPTNTGWRTGAAQTSEAHVSVGELTPDMITIDRATVIGCYGGGEGKTPGLAIRDIAYGELALDGNIIRIDRKSINRYTDVGAIARADVGFFSIVDADYCKSLITSVGTMEYYWTLYPRDTTLQPRVYGPFYIHVLKNGFSPQYPGGSAEPAIYQALYDIDETLADGSSVIPTGFPANGTVATFPTTMAAQNYHIANWRTLRPLFALKTGETSSEGTLFSSYKSKDPDPSGVHDITVNAVTPLSSTETTTTATVGDSNFWWVVKPYPSVARAFWGKGRNYSAGSPHINTIWFEGANLVFDPTKLAAGFGAISTGSTYGGNYAFNCCEITTGIANPAIGGNGLSGREAMFYGYIPQSGWLNGAFNTAFRFYFIGCYLHDQVYGILGGSTGMAVSINCNFVDQWRQFQGVNFIYFPTITRPGAYNNPLRKYKPFFTITKTPGTGSSGTWERTGGVGGGGFLHLHDPGITFHSREIYGQGSGSAATIYSKQFKAQIVPGTLKVYVDGALQGQDDGAGNVTGSGIVGSATIGTATVLTTTVSTISGLQLTAAAQPTSLVIFTYDSVGDGYFATPNTGSNGNSSVISGSIDRATSKMPQVADMVAWINTQSTFSATVDASAPAEMRNPVYTAYGPSAVSVSAGPIAVSINQGVSHQALSVVDTHVDVAAWFGLSGVTGNDGRVGIGNAIFENIIYVGAKIVGLRGGTWIFLDRTCAMVDCLFDMISVQDTTLVPQAGDDAYTNPAGGPLSAQQTNFSGISQNAVLRNCSCYNQQITFFSGWADYGGWSVWKNNIMATDPWGIAFDGGWPATGHGITAGISSQRMERNVFGGVQNATPYKVAGDSHQKYVGSASIFANPTSTSPDMTPILGGPAKLDDGTYAGARLPSSFPDNGFFGLNIAA